jgi:asparagine synthase (glutamine-hydrolysing)
MCGIAGAMCSSAAASVGAVRRMNDAQAHRGPDGVGVYTAQVGRSSLALGHRRLAIQDVSPSGHQPMVNPATEDVVVYNGELYNVNELRKELSVGGAPFRGRSDTEVLLRAFERWGTDCLDRLYGMFAFGIYRPSNQRLYLARDPLGIKPLYIARTKDGFAFASELKGILASGMVENRVDRYGLASLLAYGAVAAPRTMIDGVHMVDPATCVEIDLSGRAPERSHVYWRFPDTLAYESSPGSVGEALREPLERAVSSHLISEVPVGVFLSSGLDSTAVAVLAAQARGGDIDTLTVSLAEDPSIDESRAAAETAQVIGARHHAVRLGASEALELTRRWLASIDQPTVDGLNTFVISRAVREHGIVVALSGLGGDELFGGYTSFRNVPRLVRLARMARWLPAPQRRRIAERIVRGTRGRKGGDLAASSGSVLDLYLLWRRVLSDADMERLGFEQPELRAAGYLPPEVDATRYVSKDDVWASVRELETRLYMGNMLLRDADVFGMRHGLEIRVPLLDRRVVDTALAWSLRTRGIGHANKPWLTSALRGRLPSHVLHQKKRGFSLPQAKWMRGVLRDEFESHLRLLASSGMLEPKAVWGPWHQFIDAKDQSAWSRAWLMATLGAWLQQIQTPLSDASNVGEAPLNGEDLLQ